MRRGPWIHKTLNVGLRLASLASKLALTLYMGRYLGLDEMGVYGLVFGAVMILGQSLGGRLDFVVNRDLVGETDAGALRKMRDQAVFYGLHYLLFAFVMGVLALSGLVPSFILFSVFALSVLESVTNMTATNLVALGHPLFSTFLFFVRAGLWGLVAVACGFFFPTLRNVETILSLWILGEFFSLVLTLYGWRSLPWGEVGRTPVDWGWIKAGARQSFGIWLGTLGGIAALHVDRFVVSGFLNMEQVGILTFFSSFSVALLSLVQSGFFAFSYPRLIEHYRAGNKKAFWREFHRTNNHVALFVLLAALGVGLGVPLLGRFLGKSEIAAESSTLWLLLISVWIRGIADSLHYVLYARHQDRATWLGALLFLVPALGGNLLFVPLLGLEGAGVSAIAASIFLFLWRFYYVRWGDVKKISEGQARKSAEMAEILDP